MLNCFAHDIKLTLRYQLGEWFNLVEGHDRYLDDNAIQLTSNACDTWRSEAKRSDVEKCSTWVNKMPLK